MDKECEISTLYVKFASRVGPFKNGSQNEPNLCHLSIREHPRSDVVASVHRIYHRLRSSLSNLPYFSKIWPGR